MLGTSIYTNVGIQGDWIPRQADNIILFAEEIDISNTSGTVTLTIQLYHKNTDEVGDGTSVGSPIVLDGSSPKFKSTQVEGLKELVRVAVLAVGDADASYVFGWIHYRILSPIWYDSASV